MEVVRYEEVNDIFCASNIWIDGKEEYWFRYAWSLLEKQHMTVYEQPQGFYRGVFYAVALAHTYGEFCHAAFDEYYDLSPEDLLYEAGYSEFQIGQMVGKLLPETVKIYDDIEEALSEIVQKATYEVYHALKKEITVSEAFKWMYCTGYTPYRTVPINEEDPSSDWDEVPYEVNSFEEYRNMLQEEEENIFDYDHYRAAGFEYLSMLM